MSEIKPSYKITNQKDSFFLAEDLKIFNPDFFAGTSKGIRKIIEKKFIPDSEIIFANEVKNKWNICTSSSKKAKLFISKSWCENNFFKKNSNKKEIIQEIQAQEEQKEIIEELNIDENNNCAENEVIENAPNIINLDDEEKFKDADGNVIDIETRGERDRKKIFFKVKDIMNGFEMPNLKQSLLDNKKGNYERNIHFKTFNRKITVGNSDHKQPNKKQKTSLYLTYKGFLRVLFVSRNKNAEKFQDWAEEKLFTMQMGNQDKKEELGCEILNMDVKAYRAVFKNHACDFPCIYLLKLGQVKDLRSTFNIDPIVTDNLCIYKFGNSNNIERRMLEHQNDYGKMKNVKLEMSIFHFIDSKYLYEAETDIKQFFKNFKKSIEVDGRNELVALDEDGLKQTKNLYRMVGSGYSGATEGLQKKIAKIEMEYKESRHQLQIDLLKKDMEIERRDLIIKNKDMEIQNRDLIIQIRDLQIEKLTK